MSVAVLFPGQGSQFVGMGEGLFESEPELLVTIADEVLGWSLRDMCLNGPEVQLVRTEHAQPALFAISFALWTVFRRSCDVEIAAGAGHSLGELTALCAADSISYPDALEIVSRRGRAMAAAADLEPSGMAALLGADEALAVEVASRSQAGGGRLQVANLNAPGQVVVAGSAGDIEWLLENGRELGVRRVVPLKVAGAFHSSFMEPASAEVGAALADRSFRPPTFPVWSNTTAEPHRFESIAETLRSQVVSPVRFEESLRDMAAGGVDRFVHVGPGDLTAGMARRTIDEAEVHVISAIEDIHAAADALVTIA
jgi:[acyl-carrier-protein] S-malonyltransferase